MILSSTFLASCHDEIAVLPHVEGAAGVILLFEGDDIVSAFANELGPGAPGLFADLPTRGELFALYYPHAPGSYGIPNGTLAPASAPPHRALPAPFATLRAEISGDIGEWETSTQSASRAYRSFRLPLESSAACLLRYGCYQPDAPLVCREPCPEQAAPRMPEASAIAPPDLRRDDSCPQGWTPASTVIDGAARRTIEICEPPSASALGCGVGAAPFPRRGGCARVGDACPSDGWAATPDGRALFLRSGAMGGDGSRARPYGRIDVALSAAAPGDWIVLAPGDYAPPAEIPQGISVAGACTASVTISGESRIAIHSGTSIRGVRFEGVGLDIATESEGAILDGNVIRVSSSGPGVVVRSGRVEIRGTAVFSAGRAIELQGDASLVAEDLVAGAGDGLLVQGNASATVTASLFDIERGQGLQVTGGRLFASQVVLEGEADHGVTVLGGRALIEDLVVRGASTDRPASGAIVSGGTLDLVRARIVGTGHGVWLVGPGLVRVHDLVVVESGITGITVGAGRLVAERVLLERAGEYASLFAEGTFPEESELEIEDVHILEAPGEGLSITGSARLAATGVLITDCAGAAINVQGSVSDQGPPSVDMTRLVVLRNRNEAVLLRGNRFIRLTEALIADGMGTGFIAGEFEGETRVEARDLAIRRSGIDASCRTAADCTGVGVVVRGGRLDLESFEIRETPLAGIVVAAGGQMRAKDGTLAASPIGFRLFEPELSPSSLMENVRVDRSVMIPCDPCGVQR